MRRRRPLVLLDANAALLPFRSGFPLFAEVERLVPGAEVVVPVSVRVELDGLARRGVAHASAARAWVASLPTLATSGQGDDAIVRAAVRARASVTTADRALVERLRRAGVSVLTPRDRHRLELRPPTRSRASGNG